MTGLNKDALLRAAREQAGLEDFGDEDFIDALERLLHSLNEEAELNATGELTLSAQYTQLLVNRLRFQHDLERHPDIIEEPLAPPLVVIGLPRSGTTKLHRVLAAHPDTQSLALWQLMNPAPFPGAAAGGEDPRIGFARDAIALMSQLYPQTLAGHPMDAEEAEEESQYLMEMTFDGALVPVRAHVPSFSAWRWQRSQLPCYRYLRQLLQYLQWQSRRRNDPVRPYVLKNPLHLGHIDALLEVFPDATIIHCHRDPVTCVPSFARLVEVGWNMVCDRADMREFGEMAMDLLDSHMRRYLHLRPGLEEQHTFVDVRFGHIVVDARATATDCYRAHGLAYDTSVAARISAWEQANPTPEHGQHDYSLENYGLAAQDIHTRFADYYAQFFEQEQRHAQ